jgi:hypothetical protein
MGYQQAFHTCCRDGLTTPNLGFQYQAVSPGLSRDQLASLARQLAGYLPGPSAPPTPNAAQIAEFPISLRYFQVPGVGGAVSQTVYVGREDRSSDSGRFGNYFTHILTLPGGMAFDAALRPITMWGSPDWRTDAGPSDATELSSLKPGQVSESAAQQLLSDSVRRGWFVAAHDWLSDVVANRSRIVVLDDRHHGWAWVAALTLGLPARLAEQLSFDTFTGEPDRSAARICVADPASDRTALSHRELTGELHVIDLTTSPPQPRGLLARVVAEGRTHACGAGVDDDLSLDEIAVVSAAAGPQPLTLETHDIGMVLSTMTHWLEAAEPHAGDLDRAAALVDGAVYDENEMADVKRDALVPLCTLVAERSGSVSASVEALAVRLALVMPGWLTGEPVPRLDSSGATPDVVGAGIGLMSREGVAPADQNDHLHLLSRIGLVGVNSALDRRIGAVAAACVAQPGVVEWLLRLARSSDAAVVLEEVIQLVCRAGSFDEPALAFLTDETVGRIHEQISGEGEAFSVTYGRAVARQHAEPEQRSWTLEWALAFADTPQQAESLIDATYGERLNPRDLRTVLGVLSSVGRQPGRERIEDGWRMLEKEDPFSGDASVRELASDLHAIDQSGGTRSIYLTIWLEQERHRTPPDEWLAKVARYAARLNDFHLKALLRRVCHGITESTISGRDHREMVRIGVEQLGQPFIDCYWEELTWALKDVSQAELVAETISIWIAADGLPMQIVDAAEYEWLPTALGPWSEDARDAIGVCLREGHSIGWAEWWESWRDEHRAAGALGRQFRRVRTRRPRG